MDQKEGRLLLAEQAIVRGQISSDRAAAKVYNIIDRTLQRRRAGIPSRRDCTPNLRKLTDLEESVILERVLDLDSRGFGPRLAQVEDMANQLRTARGKGTVGKNWAYNFVRRMPELKMRFNRKYDYQRAKNEDPEVISAWFELVRNTKAKYGITDDDTYNFDEIGFMMGIIATAKVITASERRSRPKAIQPGNREWVTVIQGVSALGWALPPYIIFAGKNHLFAWFSTEISPDWRLDVSENGWTTNKLGFKWLQHFEKHTLPRTKGTYRLLIIDGHESHNSLEFQDFCKQHNIITLCMPPHSSHLLQPLDVGCFSPLKRAYGTQVEQLIRYGINHITKVEFLPAFQAAYTTSLTPNNIRSGFRAAGLLPYDPEAVISKLDVRLKTPTPSLPEELPWVSQTPGNTQELDSQRTLIRESIVRHKSSSISPILHAVDHFLKGAQTMAHRLAILEAENAALRTANELATKRRQRKRKRIKYSGSLTVQEGLDLIDQTAVNTQILQETRQHRTRPEGSAPRQRRCGRCREPGHRIETCPLSLLEA
jgi:hypothetical protein